MIFFSSSRSPFRLNGLLLVFRRKISPEIENEQLRGTRVSELEEDDDGDSLAALEYE